MLNTRQALPGSCASSRGRLQKGGMKQQSIEMFGWVPKVWNQHISFMSDISYICDLLPVAHAVAYSVRVAFRPTQSIMYFPLQVNRFKKIILLIV